MSASQAGRAPGIARSAKEEASRAGGLICGSPVFPLRPLRPLREVLSSSSLCAFVSLREI
jgi:hypothetical protein